MKNRIFKKLCASVLVMTLLPMCFVGCEQTNTNEIAQSEAPVSEQSYSDAKISYLGPEGTYTQEACQNFFDNHGAYVPYKTVPEAVEALTNGESDYAVIPQENTIGGAVTDYVDTLIATESISVVGEVELPISQNLLVLPGTELSDIMDTLANQQFIAPKILTEHFWNMFIVDALLGNFDRHNGNWGFLYDEVNGSVEIAPVFDCGSCLLPQADEQTMQKILLDKSELHARVFQFPTSAIKLNNRKINYYDFITHAENDECNAALKRIFPRINLAQINRFIDSVEEISDLQKSFYKVYIKARYDLILVPSYNLIFA